jgi:hypothetical protein
MGTEKVSRKLRASVVSAGTEAEAEGKVTNLALQGGGAHGAFGWEVMDQFLEDGRLSIEGVSGTCTNSGRRFQTRDNSTREITIRTGGS